MAGGKDDSPVFHGSQLVLDLTEEGQDGAHGIDRFHRTEGDAPDLRHIDPQVHLRADPVPGFGGYGEEPVRPGSCQEDVSFHPGGLRVADGPGEHGLGVRRLPGNIAERKGFPGHQDGFLRQADRQDGLADFNRQRGLRLLPIQGSQHPNLADPFRNQSASFQPGVSQDGVIDLMFSLTVGWLHPEQGVKVQGFPRGQDSILTQDYELVRHGGIIGRDIVLLRPARGKGILRGIYCLQGGGESVFPDGFNRRRQDHPPQVTAVRKGFPADRKDRIRQFYGAGEPASAEGAGTDSGHAGRYRQGGHLVHHFFPRRCIPEVRNGAVSADGQVPVPGKGPVSPFRPVFQHGKVIDPRQAFRGYPRLIAADRVLHAGMEGHPAVFGQVSGHKAVAEARDALFQHNFLKKAAVGIPAAGGGDGPAAAEYQPLAFVNAPAQQIVRAAAADRRPGQEAAVVALPPFPGRAVKAGDIGPHQAESPLIDGRRPSQKGDVRKGGAAPEGARPDL